MPNYLNYMAEKNGSGSEGSASSPLVQASKVPVR